MKKISKLIKDISPSSHNWQGACLTGSNTNMVLPKKNVATKKPNFLKISSTKLTSLYHDLYGNKIKKLFRNS